MERGERASGDATLGAGSAGRASSKNDDGPRSVLLEDVGGTVTTLRRLARVEVLAGSCPRIGRLRPGAYLNRSRFPNGKRSLPGVAQACSIVATEPGAS
jgi:hypothetical protein